MLDWIDWKVPWTTGDAIDAVFLGVCCAVVTAVPLVYFLRANLRDPFARAILAGTGVTAFVFDLTLVATVAFHLGWDPDTTTLHWLSRGTYTAVAFGKGLFLIALLGVLRRDKARFQKQRDVINRSTDPRPTHEVR